MRRPDAPKQDILSKFTLDERAEILIKHLKFGMYLKDIAKDYNEDSFTISAITRAYTFLWGKQRGKYKNVNVKLFKEFVYQYPFGVEYYEPHLFKRFLLSHYYYESEKARYMDKKSDLDILLNLNFQTIDI